MFQVRIYCDSQKGISAIGKMLAFTTTRIPFLQLVETANEVQVLSSDSALIERIRVYFLSEGYTVETTACIF